MFGKKVTIAGLPFMSYDSLLPIERADLQETQGKLSAKWRADRLALLDEIQKACKIKDEVEAYQELSAFESGYSNSANSRVAAFVELYSVRNPAPPEPDRELSRVTYLINSRLVKEDVNTEFLAAQGVTFTGEWTYENTIAASKLIPEIVTFLATESNNGVPPAPVAAVSAGEN